MHVEPSQLISVLNKTIDDLADDFFKEGAFSFATEADGQSTLLGRLRDNALLNTKVREAKVQLVHAEFPVFGPSLKRGARYDLVIWHPDFVAKAREKWGIPIRKWDQQLQKGVNLIVIELERVPGLP